LIEIKVKRKMTELKTLLELRAKIKSKKPNFIRQDYQRRKRLGRKLKWRKPKGIHSKIRHSFKGRRKMPSPGYKSPKAVRGMHSSGLKIVNVSAINQLAKIRKENEGITISKQVGIKKKLEILKKAKELGISVLNIRADEEIKKIEELINSNKKQINEAKKDKPEKANAKAKEPREEKQKEKLPEKVAEEEKVTEEGKKEAEKKEKDEILTKRM